ncbi:MAG: hypothetical protein NZ960_03425 [Candidatus Kapabacteria bacterium]|nr:hypothetical protein [Candidatus Kapabacteria bacterium]MDW8012292.1 hypothetical protein [Bacteroidota bacterium]
MSQQTLPGFHRQRQRLRYLLLIALILGSNVLLVAYVHNVVAIEERIRQIQRLQRVCDSLESVALFYHQQLIRMEMPERVVPAAERYGFQLPTVPPRYLPSTREQLGP